MITNRPRPPTGGPMPTSLPPPRRAVRATRAGAVALFVLAFGLGAAPDEKPGLYVKVEGLRNGKGRVRCGLFASEKNWLSELPHDTAQAPIREGKAICVFHGPAKGVYGITALHDEDDDGEMDRSALGLPDEGYGASRGAVRKGVVAPEWADAKFRYGGGTKRLPIHIAYP